MEELLAKLVAMPTISDDVTANVMALDYIDDYLTKRGMHTKRYSFDHPVLLASTRPDNLLTPKILLTAHSDVVAGDEAQFTLRREGDKLYGRGTFDMKFSIAGYLQLVDDLQDSLEDYDFGIIITTDEELGSACTGRMVNEYGLRPGVCIMPDSSAPGWDIEVLAKGFWRFELIAKGKTAHGARPWEGESASFKLIQALHELKSHFDGHNTQTDSLNIGKIHGGQAYNIVPSEMAAFVEIRYLSKQTLAEKQKIIRELCKKFGLTYKEFTLCSAVSVDLKHPLVKDYLDCVEKITGRKPQNFVSCAGTDAPPYFEAGINCIISCPAGGGHHTKNEWISRESFLQFLPILHDFLEKTAKVPSKAKVPARKTAESRVA